MFVVFEGFEEVVVFGKGLIGSVFGHVVGAVLKFFSPEGDGLFAIIAYISIDEGFKLLVGGDLWFLLEPVGDSEILVYVFDIDSPSVLIVHNKSANNIFSEGFRDESVSIGCGENAFTGLLMALLLFLAELLGDLLQVLG